MRIPNAVIIVLLASVSAANAQSTMCPDRPATDSSNACANTRFVHSIPITPSQLPALTGDVSSSAGSASVTVNKVQGTPPGAGVVSAFGVDANTAGGFATFPVLTAQTLSSITSSFNRKLTATVGSRASTYTKTADFVMTPAYIGSTFDNTGASGQVSIILPTAAQASGAAPTCFRTAAAQIFQLVPFATDTLVFSGVSTSAGDAVQASAANAYTCIVSDGASKWIATNTVGTWSAWTPASISGLIRAWDTTTGVTSSSGSVSAVTGTWGTSDSLTGPVGNQPTVSALGPRNENIVKFTSSSSQYFTFTDTTTLTTITAVFELAPTCGGSTLGLFGRTAPTATNSLALSSSCQISARPLGAAGATTITPSPALNSNMQTLVIVYDSAASGGSVTVYIDGLSAGSATSVGAGGFSLAELGAQGTGSTSPFNGYMSVAALYNTALSASDVAKLSSYLKGRRGLNVYVSNSGSDSNTTFWNQAHPLKSPATAAALALHGDETIALKDGDVWHMSTERILPSTAIPNTRTAIMEGGIWGALGKAPQLRFSLNPTCTLVSGTIYNCGSVTTLPAAGTSGGGPTNFIYYVPSGAYRFWGSYTGYENTNVVRLTQGTDGTSPTSGQWGYTGTGPYTVYVNAGVALAAGEIEIPQPPGGYIVAALFNNLASYWVYRNFDIAFADATGFQNRGGVGNASNGYTFQGSPVLGIVTDGLGTFFNTLDGNDTAYTGILGSGTWTHRIRTRSAWNGAGLVAGSGGPGDCYSDHEDTKGTFTQAIGAMCDKAGLDNQTGTTTIAERSIMYGNNPYWFNPSASYACGTFTVTSSIAVVPAGLSSYTPIGMKNNATGASGTCTMTGVNMTIVGLSKASGYTGVLQTSTSSAVVLRNSIMAGWAIGAQSANAGMTNWTADHNLYYDNTADRVNAALGTGSIAANPVFAFYPYNFHVEAGSPAVAAGVAGIATVDFDGVALSSTPTIGAYQ